MKIKQSIYWGLVPGLVTAFLGSYKDTIFEPFDIKKFFRSPIISFLWYIIIDKYYKNEPVILKIGLCSMMERITVESYKALTKKEPGKFINCKVENNQCVLEKDRGWFFDRIKNKKWNNENNTPISN